MNDLAEQLAAIARRADIIRRCQDAAPNDCYDMGDVNVPLAAARDDVPFLLSLVREQAAKLRDAQDDAWKRGYEACKTGQQPHSPYRSAMKATQ